TQMDKTARRGDLRMLLCRASCLKRYALCVLTGLPLWFIAGLILTFAPEIGRSLNLSGELKSADAILYFYVGLMGGDMASGFVSQKLQSRRRALMIFIAATAASTAALLMLSAGSAATDFYRLCGVAGFFA